MTAANFQVCLTHVLADEGGNADNPHDPGGRTSRGVIQRVYDAYRRVHGEPHKDVYQASDAEIADIYRTQFWEPWCDKFPAGVDYTFFDMAVNAGMVHAAEILQHGLGVPMDGHIGIVTLEALSKAYPAVLVKAMADARRAYYKSLHTFKYFGRGWLARTARVETIALKLAQQAEEAKA